MLSYLDRLNTLYKLFEIERDGTLLLHDIGSDLKTVKLFSFCV